MEKNWGDTPSATLKYIFVKHKEVLLKWQKSMKNSCKLKYSLSSVSYY